MWSVAVIIVAAGAGTRFRSPVRKQFIELQGEPAFVAPARVLDRLPRVREIIVVLPRDAVRFYGALLRGLGLTRLRAVVAGGRERADSVARGLRRVSQRCNAVLIHDGARPFIDPAWINRAIDALNRADGAVVGMPMTDTVKQAGRTGRIVRTVPRAGLWRAQTPQVFRRAALDAAVRRRDTIDATDDAQLVERCGYRVLMVRGSDSNIKLTTPDDGETARRLAGQEQEMTRVGCGYDIHRFARKRRLMLGGVRIPRAPGLEGHSDADVLLHAIADALLGAAGLPDIGIFFPNTDRRFRNIASIILLKKAYQAVRQAGFMVVNTDCVVVAEQPKIAAYVPAMKRKIAVALGIGADAVGIKATTAEGLGSLGRGEGIAARCACLLSAVPAGAAVRGS